MTSVRLPVEIEQKLESLSTLRHKSKTELIKEALVAYLGEAESEMDSYELGAEHFGRFGSGNGSLSATYKRRIKDKIRAKHNPR